MQRAPLVLVFGRRKGTRSPDLALPAVARQQALLLPRATELPPPQAQAARQRTSWCAAAAATQRSQALAGQRRAGPARRAAAARRGGCRWCWFEPPSSPVCVLALAALFLCCKMLAAACYTTRNLLVRKPELPGSQPNVSAVQGSAVACYLAVLMLRNHLVHLRQEVDAAEYVVVHRAHGSAQQHPFWPRCMVAAQRCNALQNHPLHETVCSLESDAGCPTQRKASKAPVNTVAIGCKGRKGLARLEGFLRHRFSLWIQVTPGYQGVE